MKISVLTPSLPWAKFPAGGCSLNAKKDHCRL
jgi:hypothetical protein